VFINAAVTYSSELQQNYKHTNVTMQAEDALRYTCCRVVIVAAAASHTHSK
jgi:hypothetical protein